MSKYLSLLVISNPVLAANNRGETDNNLQTLQKIGTRRGVRTVLSGQSIRRAIRDSMQASGAKMWRRTIVPTEDNPVGYIYGDNDSPTMANAEPPNPEGYDDEMFGWMVAAKGKADYATKRASYIGVSAAISTTPYDGDKAFCQGLKAKAGDKGKPDLAPFSAERHWTRYQFLVTLDLEAAGDRAHHILESLKGLQVGGSHTANLTELTPDLLAWRTHTAPGQSGLYLGAGIVFSPDEPVDIEPLRERAANLGIYIQVAGIGQEMTVAEAIKAIKEEVLV